MSDDAPETSELHAFVTAVDEGSLSAAARALRLPRVTLGRRLSRLEECLGVRLLHRTTRRLTMTDAGDAFYGHARAVLAAVSAATRAVQQPSDVPRGVLRVSAMPLSSAILREVLLDFVEAYPLVEVELITSTAMLDLRAARVDVALRASAELDPDLVARKLLTSTMCAVASPAYQARRGLPTHTEALAEHACLVGFARGEHPATHWPLLDGGRVRVRGPLASNDLQVLYDGALRGLGIALLPQAFTAAGIAEGRLVAVLPELVGTVSTIALVFPDRELLKPAVRAFVDHVVGQSARLSSLATLPPMS